MARINKKLMKTPLQTKALINAIAEDCKYHKYEVEDILNSLVRVCTKSFIEETPVRISFLCTLVPAINEPKMCKNFHTKEVLLSKRSRTLKVIPSGYLIKQMTTKGEALE